MTGTLRHIIYIGQTLCSDFSQGSYSAHCYQCEYNNSFFAAFMLYWFLGVLMDGPAAFIGWMTGIQISPHFDAPYLSTSISSFWSRRWNLTVGNVLRFLCYDPVHEGQYQKTAWYVKSNKCKMEEEQAFPPPCSEFTPLDSQANLVSFLLPLAVADAKIPKHFQCLGQSA